MYETGTLRDSISHRVVGDKVYIGSDSEVAVFHEFGTKHMPPRPIFQAALARKMPEIVERFGGRVHAFLSTGDKEIND